jgi:hypothetical protein
MRRIRDGTRRCGGVAHGGRLAGEWEFRQWGDVRAVEDGGSILTEFPILSLTGVEEDVGDVVGWLEAEGRMV